ncbi:MAG TPA: hypothetical protein DIS94_10460 [Bacteroidetes bacterium]|nr:hypothetical protein [Bacteroidota bacterium]
MKNYSKEFDAYYEKIKPFAKPVFKHFRKLVHEVFPEIEEKLKWGMPSFEYKGIVCGFAAFKEHCMIGFWKAAIMKDREILLSKESKGSMGNLGKITSLKDLPSDKTLKKWIKEAIELNEKNIKLPKSVSPKHEKIEYEMPDEFRKLLNRNKTAKETFEKFSPSHKREYLEWICEAKTEETKIKRMDKSIEWLTEGKSRNWKYQRKK